MKVTQWFSPSEKPARMGVYQVRTPGNGKIFYCYWTGAYWGLRRDTSLYINKQKSHFQKVTWRGIAMPSPATSHKSASRQAQASRAAPASSHRGQVQYR